MKNSYTSESSFHTTRILHINAFIYSFADGNKNFKIKTDMKNLYISPNSIIFIIRRVECIHYFSLMKIFITTVFICRNMLLCCMIKVLLGKRTNCNSFFFVSYVSRY